MLLSSGHVCDWIVSESGVLLSVGKLTQEVPAWLLNKHMLKKKSIKAIDSLSEIHSGSHAHPVDEIRLDKLDHLQRHQQTNGNQVVEEDDEGEEV